MKTTNDISASIVTALYRYFLLREPDAGGLAASAGHLVHHDFKTAVFEDMLKAFSSSEEFRLKQDRFLESRLGMGEVVKEVDLMAYLPHAPALQAGQKNLFISGQYRSGTTALVSLLNFSTQIFVTHEDFNPISPAAWSREVFTRESHAMPCLFDLLPDHLRSSIKPIRPYESHLQSTFPEVEFGDDFSFPLKRVLPATHLIDSCVAKNRHVLEHYEDIPIVGDKEPVLLDCNLPLRLLVNPWLQAVLMVRDPIDILISSIERKAGDVPFNVFLDSQFWQDIEDNYRQVGQLQKACGDRVITVRYEGFFESEDRVGRLFTRLGIDPSSVNWEGVRYLSERSRRLSEVRSHARARFLTEEGDRIDEAVRERIHSYIDWQDVI
jgi:hypothetical protein